MTITLNHTIVSARDKDAAARFFAKIFGLRLIKCRPHMMQIAQLEKLPDEIRPS